MEEEDSTTEEEDESEKPRDSENEEEDNDNLTTTEEDKPLDQSIKTGKKPLGGKIPRMNYQNHYDHMYRCMKTVGASKEEAHTGAKAAANHKQVKSYYLSKKLLLNQQQQTVSLLAQVPAFNELSSTKFEDWIKHFDAVMNTSEFEEGRKIKLLCSKLFGSATDCVTTFQLRYPREAKEFPKIKQCLQERYHGGDSRKIYLTEYKN
ncbi:Uncharacterized protein APZ42_030190 [Daphnia magna]|uniref:Uncharacterized protein n=1 Tax=Daphnia magna TaxID=35525 RepID=A0A164P044_9CRUS|nr:Uncharacterized protein APZ42_030190 [Daphnia magna]